MQSPFKCILAFNYFIIIYIRNVSFECHLWDYTHLNTYHIVTQFQQLLMPHIYRLKSFQLENAFWYYYIAPLYVVEIQENTGKIYVLFISVKKEVLEILHWIRIPLLCVVKFYKTVLLCSWTWYWHKECNFSSIFFYFYLIDPVRYSDLCKNYTNFEQNNFWLLNDAT